jgi:hypothetical protein
MIKILFTGHVEQASGLLEYAHSDVLQTNKLIRIQWIFLLSDFTNDLSRYDHIYLMK